MPNNEELKRLHMERLARTNPIVTNEKAKAADSADKVEVFECPVCYNDGSDVGTVSPKCGHKLCLSCYSNILLRGGDNTKCPCCRAPYLKVLIEEEVDPYSGMPPLIEVPPLNYAQYIMLSRLTLADALHGDHLMNLLTDMSQLANSLDDLIEPPEQQEMN